MSEQTEALPTPEEIAMLGDLAHHATDSADRVVHPIAALAPRSLRPAIMHRLAYHYASCAAIGWAMNDGAPMADVIERGMDHPKVAEILRGIGRALMAAPDRAEMDRQLAALIGGLPVDPPPRAST